MTTILRWFIFTLPVATLLSCAPYNYEAQQNKRPDMHFNGPPGMHVNGPLYSMGHDGVFRRDLRMERVRARGCVDNSTDCGRPAGW